MSDRKKTLAEDVPPDDDGSHAEPPAPPLEAAHSSDPQDVPVAHSVEEAAALLRQLDSAERPAGEQESGDPVSGESVGQGDPVRTEGAKSAARGQRVHDLDERPNAINVALPAPAARSEPERIVRPAVGLGDCDAGRDDGVSAASEPTPGMAGGTIEVSAGAADDRGDFLSSIPQDERAADFDLPLDKEEILAPPMLGASSHLAALWDAIRHPVLLSPVCGALTAFVAAGVVSLPFDRNSGYVWAVLGGPSGLALMTLVAAFGVWLLPRLTGYSESLNVMHRAAFLTALLSLAGAFGLWWTGRTVPMLLLAAAFGSSMVLPAFGARHLRLMYEWQRSTRSAARTYVRVASYCVIPVLAAGAFRIWVHEVKVHPSLELVATAETIGAVCGDASDRSGSTCEAALIKFSQQRDTASAELVRTQDAAKPYLKGVAAWLAGRQPLDTNLNCYRGAETSAASVGSGPSLDQLMANAAFLRPSERALRPLAQLGRDDRFNASNALRLAEAQQLFWASGGMLGPTDAGPAAVARALASGRILPFPGGDRTGQVPELDCRSTKDGAASIEFCPLVAMGGAAGSTPEHIGCLIRIQEASASPRFLVGFKREAERDVFLQELIDTHEAVKRDFAWEVKGQAVIKPTPLEDPDDQRVELHGVEIRWGSQS